MLKLGVAYTLSLLKYIRKGYGDNMILTSRIAKNYEKIIKSGRYEADKVPDTMKRMPNSSNEVPDTIEKMPDNEQEQQIYKYVLENGSVTAAETAELLEVKPRRARAVLLNMVKNGYLRKEGAARSTIYVKNTEGR